MNNPPDRLDKTIERLIEFFDTYNLSNGVFRGDYYFDEPQQYYYTTQINKNSRYFTKTRYRLEQAIYSGGNSFVNNKLAMLKCLGEAIERLCQETFDDKKILFSTYVKQRSNAIDPSIHTHGTSMRSYKLGWTSSISLNTGKYIYIPAQYSHYSFRSLYDEPPLTSLISTGGAAGTSHDETLLTGLYEVIERDAFTTTYLLQAPVTHIDIDSIENDRVQDISRELKKCLLHWHLFDITNDLETPVYLSLILDRTGMGPAVTAGASASHDPISSIIKSVSEATMSRPWARASLADNRGYYSIMHAEKKGIRKRLERALFWFFKDRIKLLSFWMDLPLKPLTRKKKSFATPKDELAAILHQLAQRSFPTYYTDITHDELRPFGFKVYKVINPKLHGLYLDETNRVIDFDRISQVADYFGISDKKHNPTPHPFL